LVKVLAAVGVLVQLAVAAVQAGLVVVAAGYVLLLLPPMVGLMVAVAHMHDALELAVLAVAVQSVLSGPETRAHSHQLVQETCNEPLH